MQIVTHIETGLNPENSTAIQPPSVVKLETSIGSGYRYVPGTAVTPIKAYDEMQTLKERLEALCQDGLIQWSGRRLKPIQPVAETQGEKTVAEIIIEDRR